AKRAEWHEADAELLERRQHLAFRLSPPQRVLALQCRDGLNRVRATNRGHARFRQAEVPDLAFTNQIPHRSRDVFDRHVRIDAVLIEQIDSIGLEPLERRVRDFPDVRRPAVETRLPAALELETELRRDDHVIANWRERLADKLFVREWTVCFRGVKERDAAIERRADDRDSVLAAGCRPVAEADAHAAEAERGDF